MRRDIEIMKNIQEEKERDIQNAPDHQLDPEHMELARHKRDTIDVVAISVDPLR